MSDSPAVTVAIPTFDRPGPLARALASVAAQSGVDFEIVVVDNSPSGTARPGVDGLKERIGVPLRYVHEPRPGVAYARNAAVAAARGGYIAFLDDDQRAGPNWLSELAKVREKLDADVVFGPIVGRSDMARGPLAERIESLLSRRGPGRDQLIRKPFGCGSCLLRRDRLPEPPFDPIRNRIGGEDDLLFARMAARGARFAWSARAEVEEYAATERCSLSWLLGRAFSFGQGPASAAMAEQPPRRATTLAIMAAGIVQTILCAGGAALLWPLSRRRGLAALEKAARGLGKTFWFRPFKIERYGEALVSRRADVVAALA